MDTARSVNRFEDDKKITIAIGREIGYGRCLGWCLGKDDYGEATVDECLSPSFRKLIHLRHLKIDIQTRPGNTISLEVRPSDTIRYLKLKIPYSEWNHIDLPDLVYNGEYLNDYRTLESYDILQDSTLECRFGPKISVRDMSGKTISMDVASSNTTIGNLKAQFPQRLFFDGKHLDNNCVIADYEIMDGSTLHTDSFYLPGSFADSFHHLMDISGSAADSVDPIMDILGSDAGYLPRTTDIYSFGVVLFEVLAGRCAAADFFHPLMDNFGSLENLDIVGNEMTTKSFVSKKFRTMPISMKYMEWYMKCSKFKGGYYDQYKNCCPSEMKAPLLRNPLARYWPDFVQEKKTSKTSLRKRWLYGGSNYRRIVEPLDIGEYCRAQTSHYEYLEKLLSKAEKPMEQIKTSGDVVKNILAFMEYFQSIESIEAHKHKHPNFTNTTKIHDVGSASSVEVQILAFKESWEVNDWYYDDHFGQTDVDHFGQTDVDQILFPSLRRIGENRLAKVKNAILQRFQDILNIPSEVMENIEFAFKEIELATSNFADHNIIGCGGFGSVYRGELFHSGQSIYKLREHLYNTEDKLLAWKQRLDICMGVAKALIYIHTGVEHTMIHRDVKPSNILLDGNWAAKLSDFGLSKIGPTMDHTHVSTVVKGSFGYLAPECFGRQKLTEKSDVFSFGAVLLEILSSRPSRLKEMKASCSRNIFSRIWDSILECRSKVFVRTMSGKTISLNVRPSDTIRDLKLKIPLSEWIYSDLPNLFYKGEHLNDNRTLDSYNISWLSTLECRLGLNISIRAMSGKTISVKVASSNTTISNLKAKFQDKEGVPQFQQKLFFNGRQLENKCTLADYKIEDGSTLLLVRRSKGWIPIYVKTHTGKTISREVKSSDTIGDVKVNITDMVGVPPYNQTLFFAGEELLDNDHTLYDYHIHSESTLSLVPVCRGRMKIYAETIDGNTIPLNVISRNTIGEVKSLIQDKEGISTHTQTLVYAGQELDDSRTLVYYLIQNETTLRLVDNTLMRREPMQIHVEIVATGRTIPLQVQTFDTINSVKSKIQSQEDIPYEQQRLFLPQIQLKDNCTLADYYIQNESTLHLVVTLIKIAVKTPAGKIITLDVDSSDTIWNVKAKIQDVEEIPRNHQKLFLAEEREQLRNSLTLAKCCVKTESTLYLLVTSDKKGD